MDYVLPPDSAVLRTEFNIVNREKGRKKIFTGSGAFFGDATINRYYSDGKINIPGFSVDTGLP